MNQRLNEAIKVIKQNDRGGYTVPTNRLYPYQWNWDSCFTALGLFHFDRNRAWREVTSLLDAQWQDGMVPHIVFRKEDPDYFPGPSLWQSQTEPPTSGHSQPPVLASVILELVRMGGPDDAKKARRIFTKIMAYHRWFTWARDPHGNGVLSIIHPWESGRDNCPDWDVGMDAISVSNNLVGYTRRDTAHVKGAQRPTHEQYDRYLTIVEFGRNAEWHHETIYRNGPFLMADPGIQFIFLRANRDLLVLAQRLDLHEHCAEIQAWIDRYCAGSSWLWNDAIGGYCAREVRTGAFSTAITNASMLCFYAQVGTHTQREHMLAHCRRILKLCQFGMPSWDPAHQDFEAQRYWRGPVWAIMNHMIMVGLYDAGQVDLADRIRSDTHQLIENHGMAEYFDPMDGAGLGGSDFSWTAAIYLHHYYERLPVS